MPITEASRHDLHLGLTEAIGEERANTLMEHLPPVGWADVATKTDIDHLQTVMNLRFDAIDAEFEAKTDRLDSKIDAIGAKFEAKTDKLDSKIDAIGAKFEAKTDKLDSKIDTKVAELRTEIAEMAKDLHRSLYLGFGGVTTVLGVLIALFR